MPIRKRILILVSVIITVPMLLVFLLSSTILDNEIERAAQGYLQNAFIIARNLMQDRLNEMKRLSSETSKSEEFSVAVEKMDSLKLEKTIKNISKVYSYLDLYMVFDEKGELILNMPKLKYSQASRIKDLIEKSKTVQSTVISEEVFNLEDLFDENSEEYNRFKVLISNNNTTKYLTKALAAISVSPVYNREGNKIIGFFVLGSLANNNNYFPEIYTSNVENSYLAISVDGIRIASNIRSPKKQNFVGSTIPVPISRLEESTNGYYGRESYDGEVHIFLDKPIVNCDGNKIAVLGVGIPENKFSIIMNTQKTIIIVVSLCCLILMAFIARYYANKITEPIIKATELANQIAKGSRDIEVEERFLQARNSETTILLEAFEKMAADLKNSEEERRIYFEKLEGEHAMQQKLSKELYLLNESLEEKVSLRTQDLYEAVAALKRAGKVKSLFLANMSHELRTPLSAIISCSEILKEEVFGPLNDMQLKYITNILNSGNHLLHIINDILDISKIESGKMTLNLGVYTISSIVEEGMTIVKSLAYSKDISLEARIMPEDFMLKVDANKLKQILCNLLSNAIKFTPANGQVSVAAVKEGSFAKFTVKDNGIGIKEEDQERVFIEFEQVDSSYERKYGGTGLGLPLTKKLVELHNGKIFLLSQPGRGTEVIVTLPLDIDESNKSSIIVS